MNRAWRNYKIELRRRMDNGDKNAEKDLRDIIIEETGLTWQKHNKTEKEHHHLNLMQKFVGPWLTEADWKYITSSKIVAYHTVDRETMTEAHVAQKLAVLGALNATAEQAARNSPQASSKTDGYVENGLQSDSPLEGPPGPEPPPVETSQNYER